MRAAEIQKYAEAYRHSDYRMGPSRRTDVRRVLAELPPGPLLDVGTGRGETLSIAREYGHSPIGTEVVDSLLRPGVQYAEAHRLPFEAESFYHVTCFDVLEHLLPQDIEPALTEFARVARKTVTVSAAVRSHVYRGVEMHPSARPMHDWDALIARVWSGFCVYRHGNAGNMSGCWRMEK